MKLSNCLTIAAFSLTALGAFVTSSLPVHAQGYNPCENPLESMGYLPSFCQCISLADSLACTTDPYAYDSLLRGSGASSGYTTPSCMVDGFLINGPCPLSEDSAAIERIEYGYDPTVPPGSP